ncbi:hypothetical protein J6590_066848 [Homalodisca vitripennis]|nr:hypothetical protein J6590_066848 [Homalodisca vitripennis]
MRESNTPTSPLYSYLPLKTTSGKLVTEPGSIPRCHQLTLHTAARCGRATHAYLRSVVTSRYKLRAALTHCGKMREATHAHPRSIVTSRYKLRAVN